MYVVPGHEPEYETYQLVDGTTRERLPKFIHWIGRFKGDHREYQDRMADLEASFKQAIGIKFRRFPVTSPQHRAGEYQQAPGVSVDTGDRPTLGPGLP